MIMGSEKGRFVKGGLSFILIMLLIFFLIRLLISFVILIDPTQWLEAAFMIIGSLVFSYVGLTIWIERWFKKKKLISSFE